MLWRVRTGRPSGFIEPCQPSPAPKPPAGPGWIHEIKHDGYRMMARRDPAGVRLFTRNGNDWSERFPAVTAAIGALKVKSCLVDGEIVVTDARGLAVFDLLRHGRQVKHEAHLFAFDLLELDGRDLTRMPLEDRKAELARLLNFSRQKDRHTEIAMRSAGLQLCEHIDGLGDVVFAHACALGCEGIVSKRLGSRYRPGPGKCADWIKVKNPAAPAVRREAEEDWSRPRRRK